MLRAVVSLNRKVRRDGDTTGYTVTLDGEVPHSPNDTEAVLEKVSELFHLAEEALAVEIERDQGGLALGHRGEESPSPSPNNGIAERHVRANPLPMNCPPNGNGHRSPKGSSSPQPATPKQLRFLQHLGKRKSLSPDDLGVVIANVLGAPKRTDDLSKGEAGRIIDHLTKLEAEASR